MTLNNPKNLGKRDDIASFLFLKDLNGMLAGITVDNVWDFLGEFETDLISALGIFGLTAADVTP